MIENYFKLGCRNIRKHLFYASVNVLGLFIGILFTMMIGAYVWGECQVNKKLRNAGQQYFLKSKWKDPNLGVDITTLGPLAKQLKEQYPSLVENYYRWDGITSVISKGEKHLRENIQLGDSTLLSMYGFNLLHGNAGTALREPYSVVITKDIAEKYFGKTAVVGDRLEIQSFSGGKHEFTITGVLDEIPENSVTHLNDANLNGLFIPTNTYQYFGRADFESWRNQYIPSYLELKKGAKIASLQIAIAQLISANTSPNISQNLKVEAIPLQDYYLQRNNGLVQKMLLALSLVGIFILLMAIVNFINIAISSAGNRMREIGVRKVMGAVRIQLIFQFLAESSILVTLAVLMALAVYPLASPFFGEIVGKALPSLWSFPVYFVWIPIALIVLLGILAGIYPAFILSSLNTVNSLKGKIKTAKENVLLRKSLVCFQFTIALLALVAAAIVTQQVAYFFGRDLGYQKEYIVAAQVPREWTPQGVRKMEVVRDIFARIPQVSSVSLSYEIPNGNNGGQPPVYKAGADSTTAIAMQSLLTDEYYLTTYQIALKSGAFFDSREQDSGKVILNEVASRALGYTNTGDAVGKQLRIPGDPTIFTVKGVTADFHFSSMQKSIEPIIFFNVHTAIMHRFLSFKLKPGNISAGIEAIQKEWAVLLPGSSFEFQFHDDVLKQLYTSELQLKKAAYVASLLSILITFIGIMGLVSLSVYKRVKEIGIRKVLGASATGIMLLFSQEFVLIILVATMIAFPLIYFIMTRWLDNYTYHISIGLLPFVISLIGIISVTLILVTIQTLKAALVKPVNSLRTE